MKRRGLAERLGFAWAGICYACRQEKSFRTHLLGVIFVGGANYWLSPPLVWQALLWIMVALVLAAELFNSALEAMLDALHPDQADFVRNAKDCAAAAVFVLSLAAIVVFALMLMTIN